MTKNRPAEIGGLEVFYAFITLSLSLRWLQKAERGGAKHATVHLITINKIIGRSFLSSKEDRLFKFSMIREYRTNIFDCT